MIVSEIITLNNIFSMKLITQLRITERIWLRAFGTPPKFPFGELQIRSGR